MQDWVRSRPARANPLPGNALLPSQAASPILPTRGRRRSALVEHTIPAVAEPVLHLLGLVLRLLAHIGDLVAHLLAQLIQLPENRLTLSLGARLPLIHQRCTAVLKLLDGLLDIGRGWGQVHVRRAAGRRRHNTPGLVCPSRRWRPVCPHRWRRRGRLVGPVRRRWTRPIGVHWRRRPVGVAGAPLAKHLTDRACHDHRGQNCNQLLHINLCSYERFRAGACRPCHFTSVSLRIDRASQLATLLSGCGSTTSDIGRITPARAAPENLEPTPSCG